MSTPGEAKIKVEPGDPSVSAPSSATASAASNPPFKPKFVPKLPTKAASPPPEEAAPASSSEPAQSSSYRAHKFEKKGGRLHKNADKAAGRGGRGGQSGNGVGAGAGGNRAGRGQWSMPMGTSFFTGNASTQLAKTRNITVGAVGSSSSSGAVGIKTEGSHTRIARPNEDTALLDQDVPPPLYHDRVLRPADDSDSDASVEAEGGPGRVEEGREVWPPRRLDTHAPVTLPLGPSTVAMRRHLAAQPLLAHPDDPTALENEELTSLFLVQLPSSLRAAAHPHAHTSTSSGSSALPSRGTGEALPARSVGKMRLHRSGRVTLATPDGQVYDVTAGLAASFQQCLAALHVPGSEGAASSSSGSGGGSGQEAGGLWLMGQVTKKLVVTPGVQDYMQTLQRERRGAVPLAERAEAESGEDAEAVIVEDG